MWWEKFKRHPEMRDTNRVDGGVSSRMNLRVWAGRVGDFVCTQKEGWEDVSKTQRKGRESERSLTWQ